MTGHSFWPLFRLAKEVLLLDLPSPAFSPAARSWGLEPYILITIYLSSDKAQGPTYVLGPFIPTIIIIIIIIIIIYLFIIIIIFFFWKGICLCMHIPFLLCVYFVINFYTAESTPTQIPRESC